jgi:hypothetical protein
MDLPQKLDGEETLSPGCPPPEGRN